MSDNVNYRTFLVGLRPEQLILKDKNKNFATGRLRADRFSVKKSQNWSLKPLGKIVACACTPPLSVEAAQVAIHWSTDIDVQHIPVFDVRCVTGRTKRTITGCTELDRTTYPVLVLVIRV